MRLLLIWVLIFLPVLVRGDISISAKVLDVVDGDTIKIKVNNIVCPIHDDGIFMVRMLYIDAPESKANAKAKEYLKSLLSLNAEISIICRKPIDNKYGKLLGEIFLKNDGTSVNYHMVSDGYAFPYMITDKKIRAEFEEAMRDAKVNKRGLWSIIK